MKTSKRLLSILLAGLLLLACSPLAYAETEPTTEITEPTAETTEPTAETTEPTAEITEPTAEITEPTAEITEPTAEITEPAGVALQEGPVLLNHADVSKYPVIRTAGATSPLYFDEGDPVLKSIAFENSAEMFSKAFAPVKDDLLAAAKALNWSKTTDALVQFVWNWAGNLQMDINGNSVHDNISRHGEDGKGKNGIMYGNEARFFYDWRLDPMDLADQFAAYVDEILALTGKDKVNVLVTSGTGTMLLAYLGVYGTGKLASIFFNQSMHNGSSVLGGLAQRKFKINAEALSDTHSFDIFFMFDIQQQAAPWLKWFHESGLLDVAVKIINLADKKIIDRIYDEALIPLMFMLPEMWGFVPMQDYEAAKKAIFKDDPKYKDFIARIDRYHYQVMARSDEILRGAAKEIKVAMIAGYNLSLMPFMKTATISSDCLVDTKLATNGATCALFNEKLPYWYKQKGNDGHNHISPDRKVDASTCVLPEQTWFIKNQYHQGSYYYRGLYDWFLQTSHVSVFANENWPQFFEEGPNMYVPVTAPAVTFQSFLLDAGYYLLKIWRFLFLLPVFWM